MCFLTRASVSVNPRGGHGPDPQRGPARRVSPVPAGRDHAGSGQAHGDGPRRTRRHPAGRLLAQLEGREARRRARPKPDDDSAAFARAGLRYWSAHAGNLIVREHERPDENDVIVTNVFRSTRFISIFSIRSQSPKKKPPVPSGSRPWAPTFRRRASGESTTPTTPGTGPRWRSLDL